MGWREFDGRTVKEALHNAAEEMGVDEETLSYEVVEDDGAGLLGLIGLKKARIRVRSGNDEIQEKIDEIKREIGIPIDGELTTDKPLVQRVQPQGMVDRRGETGREPNTRETRGPRERGNRREPRRGGNDRPAGHRRDERRDFHERKDEREKENTAAEEKPIGPEAREKAKRAREVLEEILKITKMDTRVEIFHRHDEIRLNMVGPNSGLLIGKKGATLQAFQYIVNKIVSKENNDRTTLIVDTENYQQKHREQLESMAHRMGEKAIKTRRPVTLEPMSAEDRRMVHLMLKEKSGVRTGSVGAGRNRKIVIYPEE